MLHLIYNPVAGRGRASAALVDTRAFLEAREVPYRILATEAPGHATRLAESTPGDATVVAVGGDGTAHEVAKACIGTERTLGVLPVGSGDDFAFALGMRRADLRGALERLVAGETRRVDTGVVNGESFVNAAGVGFDADVATRVASSPRPLKGFAAYLWAVVSALGALDAAPVKVWVDDAPVYAGRSLLVSTQLGPRTGGSFLFAPGASIDDGLFEVLVAGGLGRLGTLALLPRVMRGAHLGHPAVHLFHGRRVRLLWEREQPGHVEGEPLPAAREFVLELAPASLRVVA
ncbi:MAG: diacylglycerol kinase family lipid kinase [Deinococcales bacterium]